MSSARLRAAAAVAVLGISHAAAVRASDSRVFEEGMASWYGAEFHGRPTASGERFDESGLTCAHRTLPFGTMLLVTNLGNGKQARLRVNDRGPFVRNRIVDCSKGGAEALAFAGAGTARVRLEILGCLRDDRESRVDPKRRKQMEKERRKAGKRGRGTLVDDPAVPILLPVDPTRGPFEVQVGAFADRGNAERLALQLAEAGHGTRLATLHDDGLTRVRVGPYADRAAAEVAEATMRAAGYPTFIVRAD